MGFLLGKLDSYLIMWNIFLFFFCSREAISLRNLQIRCFILAPFGKYDYISVHTRAYMLELYHSGLLFEIFYFKM